MLISLKTPTDVEVFLSDSNTEYPIPSNQGYRQIPMDIV